MTGVPDRVMFHPSFRRSPSLHLVPVHPKQWQKLTSSVDLTNETALQNLCKALILHPVAGGVAFLAFVMGLLAVICASRFATVMMAILASLAALASLVIFVIDMVLWNIVKNRVNGAGGSASLVCQFVYR